MIAPPPWMRAVGLAYTVARALVLVGLAVALAGLLSLAVTAPPEAPVLASWGRP